MTRAGLKVKLAPQSITSFNGSPIPAIKFHKRDYKKFLNGKFNYITSFEIVKYVDCYIELIIEIPCNNVNQLRKFEGNYIRNMNCVNKYIAGRTRKEYRKQYNKTKHICNCGTPYTNNHKARHFKTNKHKQYIFELHNELNHLMI